MLLLSAFLSRLQLHARDAEEPDVSGEAVSLPDMAALAGRVRGCLQEGDDVARDLPALVQDRLFGLDTQLIPEATHLYAKLAVKHAPLTLIHPNVRLLRDPRCEGPEASGVRRPCDR